MTSRTALLLLVAVAFAACPPNKKCDASTCAAGCCDATGACVLATSAVACGSSGAQCMACQATQVCTLGTCTASSGNGGGTATGGGSGGGGGSTGGGGGTALDGLAAYQALAQAACAFLVRCAELPSSQQANCEGIYSTYLTRGAIAAGQVRNLRVPAAQECIAGFATLTCGQSSPSSCGGLFSPVGGVATGGACVSNSVECANLADSCGGNTCPRTCQPTPQGGNGQPCHRLTWSCDTGLFCNDQQICEAKRPAGATCSSFRDEQCQSGACENDLCASRPLLGQACPTNVCAPDAWCQNSVCAAPKAAGSTCTYRSGECASPGVCLNGLCRTPGGVGTPCTSSSYCASGACDPVLRTCQEYTQLSAGAPCTGLSFCPEPETCLGARINPDGGVGQLGTCAVPQVGSVCTSSSTCGLRLFCDPTGHCAAATAGSACDSTDNCRTTEYCGSTRICVPRFATGAQCDTNTSSNSSCLVARDRCTDAAGDSSFRCRPAVALGGACASDSHCGMLAVCRGGVCVATGELGQPCYQGVCSAGACGVDGGCVAPLPLGQSCTYYAGCTSGICKDGTCGSSTCP